MLQPGGQIPEPVPEPELSDHEKLVNEIIGTVENNGGRLAAITGRYVVNVKDGVFNYLDDAAYVVKSGNSAGEELLRSGTAVSIKSSDLADVLRIVNVKNSIEF